MPKPVNRFPVTSPAMIIAKYVTKRKKSSRQVHIPEMSKQGDYNFRNHVFKLFKAMINIDFTACMSMKCS